MVEFFSDYLNVFFFKERGIIHRSSCPYTQQNSRVEGKQRHLLTVSRSLKLQVLVPDIFFL